MSGLLVAAQVGLIVLFSDRTPITPRQPPRLPRISLPPGRAIEQFLAKHLTTGDPLLHGLVSPRGFSGPAWLGVPRLTHELRPWTEPPRWLAPQLAGLGASLWQVAQAESADPSAAALEKPGPALLALELPAAPLPARSTVDVEGDLAARPLATPLELPDWPGSDLLTNSVVQVAVNANGEVVFATLLSVRGLKPAGQKAADTRAVALARSARFKPLSRVGAGHPSSASEDGLSWGTMVFRWHTLPPTSPATNATAQADSTP